MKCSAMKTIRYFALALLCTTAAARADVRLPAIFSEHMVVQVGAQVPVFGQGFVKEFVVGELSRDHARASDVQGRLGLPGTPVYLENMPMVGRSPELGADLGLKFSPN